MRKRVVLCDECGLTQGEQSDWMMDYEWMEVSKYIQHVDGTSPKTKVVREPVFVDICSFKCLRDFAQRKLEASGGGIVPSLQHPTLEQRRKS